MATHSPEKDYSKHRCSECARFKVPDSGCDESYYIREGTRLPSDPACDKFYQARTLKPKKEKEKLHKGSGIAQEGPYEAIYDKGKAAFLVKTSEGFQISENVHDEGEVTAPLEINEFPYEPYGYSEAAVPNREDLFWKIRDEFDLFLDVESIYKEFLAACVLLSYQQEKVRTVPYPYFVGDNESGKTVGLTLLKSLCYRPLFGVAIPPADIYGYLGTSDAPGTILEDEAQGLWKDMDKAKIYKAGYKIEAKIPRTMITQHKRFIMYFRCFCLKACAAEEMPRVKGLLERFIPIHMVEGFPKKDWADIGREDEKRMKELRDTLLKWRLQTRAEELPDVDLPVKGRLKELWKPIIQMVQDLTIEKDLRAFLEYLKQERVNEKTNTLEGHIVKVIVELYVPNAPLSFNDIWESLIKDLEGKLDDKHPNKMDTSDFGDVTKQKIGYRLREVLSGKKKRMRGPEGLYWAYDFEVAKIKRIARKYGVASVLEFSTDSTSRGVSTAITPGKVHESNVVPVEKGQGESVDTLQKVDPLENSRTSIQETLEFVRKNFVEGTEEEWISFAVEAGLPKKEAEALFESLKGKDLFWYDRSDGETVWRWVKE